MGSYFTERFDALMGLPAAIAANPVIFAVLFAVFLPLIWWKWRLVGKSTQKSSRDRTHGLRADADRKQTRHETGIGTAEVLVMCPNGLGGAIWFALFFFGGGAIFYALVVLQDEPTAKDYWTFAGLCVFVIGCFALIEANQTRFFVDQNQIERRRVLYPRDRVAFSSIEKVEPLAKTYIGGLTITSKDGRRIKVPARFSGYRELMERLAPLIQNCA